MKPNLKKCSWIEDKDIFYVDDDDLPQLVLYCKELPFYGFSNPEEWTYLFHQTGGLLCEHVYVYVYFLTPTAEFKKIMEDLDQKYYNSQLYSYSEFYQIQKYENSLKKYGLTCRENFRDLSEGFYPLNPDLLEKVTKDLTIKESLKLINFDKSSKFYIPTAFPLAILGHNSD